MAEATNTGFLDISASDLIGAYMGLEQKKAEVDIAKYNAQSAAQQAAFDPPEATGYEEALDIDNARVPGTADGSVRSYWERIPKPLLYGSGALLFTGVVLKLARG